MGRGFTNTRAFGCGLVTSTLLADFAFLRHMDFTLFILTDFSIFNFQPPVRMVRLVERDINLPSGEPGDAESLGTSPRVDCEVE